MSKQGYFQRYFCIISNIKKHKILSFDKIQAYVLQQAAQFEIQTDTYIGFSKRTFQRDIKEIEQLFSINILFDRKAKGYYIEDEFDNNISDRMLEILDVFNTVQMTNKTQDVIFLESRRPVATFYIDIILEAIKKHQKILLQYKKFSEKSATKRTIAPYAIKEFKNRWYLLGIEDGTNYLKSFAFDRFITLNIQPNKNFQRNNIDINQLYQDCFGIIMPQQEKVQKVVLEFDNFQKEYIKSLPLHHTQMIISEDDNSMQITMNIYITHDFITEILSYGSHVKVIKPASLVQKITQQLKGALSNY